jgi:hypothetical protein
MNVFKNALFDKTVNYPSQYRPYRASNTTNS